MSIELKVGNCHNICFIAGTCYYPKGWRKFEVCAPEKYVNEFFIQTLNDVKLKIKEDLKHYEVRVQPNQNKKLIDIKFEFLMKKYYIII